jgi:WD40 repeat protein
MNGSLITDSCLDSCKFIESDLRNIEYGINSDFIVHKGKVLSVAFSPDGKYLASGSRDNTVKLWSLELQKEVSTLQEYSSYFLSVTFSPDGKYLASGSGDKTIKLWSIEQQKEVTMLQGHSERVWSVVFTSDGKYLASGSLDKTVKIWSIES